MAQPGQRSAKRTFHGHVTGLLELGHELEVWCPPTADDSFLPLAGLVRVHVLPWSQPTESSVARVRRQLRFGNHPLRASMEAHWAVCAHEMEQGEFDVVLATTCRRFFTSGLGGQTRLPSVVYLQEPNRRLTEAIPQSLWAAPPPSNRFRPWRDLPRQLDHAVVLREARTALRTDIAWLGTYDQVLVNSRFSRENVLRGYGIDARVCSLGVDLDLFGPSDQPPLPYAVGIGAIVPAKGIDLAIRAIALLPEPWRRLVWIGNTSDPGYADGLRRLAVDLGLDLDFRVGVDDEVLVGILQRATVMLSTATLEPFGFAPVEAMACGIPVVAVAEGGVRESVEHDRSGLLVDHSPKDVADAAHLVFRDPDRRTVLSEGARRHAVEVFDARAASRRLEAELARVAG